NGPVQRVRCSAWADRVGVGKGFRIRIVGCTDSLCNTKEVSKSAAKNAVHTDSITNIVLSPNLAAVILELLVGLERLLGRKDIRSGTEQIARSCARGSSIPDDISQLRNGIVNSRTVNGVHDSVAEFQVAYAEAMGPGTGVEINAAGVDRGVVHVGEW